MTCSLFSDKQKRHVQMFQPGENITVMTEALMPIGKGIVSQYGNGIMKLIYNKEEYIGHFGGT